LPFEVLLLMIEWRLERAFLDVFQVVLPTLLTGLLILELLFPSLIFVLHDIYRCGRVALLPCIPIFGSLIASCLWGDRCSLLFLIIIVVISQRIHHHWITLVVVTLSVLKGIWTESMFAQCGPLLRRLQQEASSIGQYKGTAKTNHK